MAESLRRLVNIETFTVLQEKLERWSADYYINTCDQNTARCCEIIELNAKVQGQLFKLLSLCATEGGMYGGASIIKSRLLPWLGQNFFTSGGAVTADTSLSVLAEAAAKDRELVDMQEMYEKSLDDIDLELSSAKTENADLKDELTNAKLESEKKERASASEKALTEIEVSDLKKKLAAAEAEVATLNKSLAEAEAEAATLNKSLSGAEAEVATLNKSLAAAEAEVATLRPKAGLLSEYQLEVSRLRDDIALLSTRRDVLLRLPELSYLDPVRTKLETKILESKLNDLSLYPYYRYIPGPHSPLSIDDTLQRIRQQNLTARFNDMFAQDRLSTMDTLRRFSDDHENNQRIVFAIMQEAFNTAKVEFRSFKMKTRVNLAKTHFGPDTLEEAVQDYVNRNVDLYDLPGMTADVIRALNRNIKISLPPETSYAICQPFIREAAKMAWQMSALAHPLDIAVATDAELYDDTKYRRSYDSEYTAPLVNHHIWPCLMQGVRVLVKGEALTKRGASLGTPRARSPVRPLSPARSLSSLSPSRFRSRSPSPARRARSPRRARFT